jgi:hypothetical protein
VKVAAVGRRMSERSRRRHEPDRGLAPSVTCIPGHWSAVTARSTGCACRVLLAGVFRRAARYPQAGRCCSLPGGALHPAPYRGTRSCWRRPGRRTPGPSRDRLMPPRDNVSDPVRIVEGPSGAVAMHGEPRLPSTTGRSPWYAGETTAPCGRRG